MSLLDFKFCPLSICSIFSLYLPSWRINVYINRLLCRTTELIPQTAMRRQTFPTIAARRSTHR